MHLEEAHELLREEILALDQQTLYVLSDKEKYANLVTACVNFLKIFGYDIKHPKSYAILHERIKSVDDLVSYYNALVTKYYPDYANAFVDREASRMHMQKFVELRMADSLADRKMAIKECAEIMRVTFESGKDLGVYILPYPAMFYSKKWFSFLNKTIEIINNNETVIKEEEREKEFDKIAQKLLEDGVYKLGYDLDALEKET